MKTIKNKPIPKLQVCAIAFFVAFVSFNSRAQTIARDDNDVSGTVCPNTKVKYKINNIGGYTGCTKTWKATGGTIQGNADLPTVEVKWDDTRGQMTKLELSFTSCTGLSDKNATTLEELVLSVKDQSWGSYTNSYNIDFCSKAPLRITMPEMNVQGTGQRYRDDKLYVPVKQVQYEWKLPAGWTSATYDGKKAITTSSFIDIIPINCSEPGIVSVVGSITNICNDVNNPPAYSSTASITLSGVRPNVTMAPQAGYTGVSTACNKTPVTFTAYINQPFSCLTGYEWKMPAGWKINSQSGNTVVLQPSGSAADRGDIYATANFSCGSKYNSGSYPIRYVDPTITSSANAICTTSQFSINNATGVSATWSSSSPAGLSFNSTGLATRINNYSGRVTVSATLSCGTTVSPTSMFVGNPAASNNTLIWLRTRGESSVQTLPGTTYEFRVDNVDGANAYTWVIPRGFAPLWGSKTVQTTSIYITTSPVAGTYSFFCRAENACGSSPTRSLVINNRIGGGGGAPLRTTASLPYQEATVYPNPANKVLNVQLAIPEAGVSQMMDSPIELMLYNSNKKLVYQTVTTDVLVSISLDDIPKGDYFLIISSKQKVDQKRIRVTN